MFDINFVELFQNIPSQLAIVLIALIPVTELRAAIPIGLFVYEMPIWEVFLLSVLSNIVVAGIIIYSLGPVYNFFSGRLRMIDKFFIWLFKRTRKNFFRKYEVWGNIALMIFVSIPLPITGAWTASLASWLFGIPKKRSLFYISLGVIISAVVVTLISLGVVKVF